LREVIVTEFEELALKKITKDYLVDCVYNRLNVIAGRYGISNAEISKRIGWDPAGFNQKYNRSNDLRITTFIKIYVALADLIAEKEAEMGLDSIVATKIQLDDLITQKELEAGALFNHISAAAEGNAEFLNEERFAVTYKQMKPFVFVGKRNNKFNDREIAVYINYYKIVAAVESAR
jgi:hypothetical protein